MSIVYALLLSLLALTSTSIHAAAISHYDLVLPEAKILVVDSRTGQEVPHEEIYKRDDISIRDLLTSCPTTLYRRSQKERRKSVRADTCVFNKDSDRPDGKVFTVKKMLSTNGNALGFLRNCNHSTTPENTVVSGSATFQQSFQVNIPGPTLDLTPYAYGLSTNVGQYQKTVVVNDDPFSLAPNRAGTLLAYQSLTPTFGTIQINYPKRVQGHYLYYITGVRANLLAGDPVLDVMSIGCNDPIPVLDH